MGKDILLSLSGGVDSAFLLKCLDSMKDINVDCINFSISTKNLRCDDTKIVEQLCKKSNKKLIEVKNTENLKINNIGELDLLTSLDNLNFYNNYGFHVNIDNFLNDYSFNLNGDGGDYLFNGISYSVDYFVRQKDLKTALNCCKVYMNRKHIKKNLINYFKLICGPFIPFYKNKLYYDLFWKENVKNPFHDKKYQRKYISYQQKLIKKSAVFKDYSKRYIIDFIFPKGDYYDSTFVNGRIVRPLMSIQALKFALSVPNIFNNTNCFENKEFENCKLILKDSIKKSGLLEMMNFKTNYGSILKEILMNSANDIKTMLKREWKLEQLNFLNIHTIKNKIKVLLNQIKDNQFLPNENTMYLIKVINLEAFLEKFDNYIEFSNNLRMDCKNNSNKIKEFK